jgi:hypothetical protein
MNYQSLKNGAAISLSLVAAQSGGDEVLATDSQRV